MSNDWMSRALTTIIVRFIFILSRCQVVFVNSHSMRQPAGVHPRSRVCCSGHDLEQV